MFQSRLQNGAGVASKPLLPGRRASMRLHATPKKLNTYDKNWAKEFFGFGYFVEDEEKASANYYERLEKKKVLSSVESSGLLSAAEKAGVTLGKIEEWGLLSTAENLGLLSVAERALTTSPGTISSLSIPFFVATVLALVVIPSDNAIEAVLRFGVAGALGTGFLTFFVGGFLLASLEDE